MKKPAVKYVLSFLCTVFFLSAVAPFSAVAQRRDYMTEAEAELVREAQEINLRVNVLTKMIDRRFAVLNNESVKNEKNSEKWGELPAGTRLDLLSDIAQLLQKSVDDIDDVAAHNRMDSKLFPKAMKNLAEAAHRYLPKLKSVYDQNPDPKETGLLIGATELCESIIEASTKVPKEAPKEGKKKKSKDDTE